MACRLFGAKPLYLNQCWLIACWTIKDKLQSDVNGNSSIFILENVFENTVCELAWRPLCLGFNVLTKLTSQRVMIHVIGIPHVTHGNPFSGIPLLHVVHL